MVFLTMVLLLFPVSCTYLTFKLLSVGSVLPENQVLVLELLWKLKKIKVFTKPFNLCAELSGSGKCCIQ